MRIPVLFHKLLFGSGHSNQAPASLLENRDGPVRQGQDAIPWDVLNVCRRLVKEGIAVEGAKDQRDKFRRK